MNARPQPKGKRTGGGARSASRLGAVQALYQMEQSNAAAETVVREFLDHRFGREVDGTLFNAPDGELFADIVKGASEHHAIIDPLISGALTTDWTLARLEAVIRAILRAGVYELRFRPDVPTRVIINEYLDVAHAFYSGPEPALVNGILDRLAKDLRPPE